MVDYNLESEKLGTSDGIYFRPEVGSARLFIMDEPEEDKYVDPHTKEEKPQWKLKIKTHDQQELLWSVTKASTHNSLYGQLVLIGKYKGKLKGEVITLLVKESTHKDGKARKEYTLVEAVEFMKREKDLKEKQKNNPPPQPQQAFPGVETENV